VQTVLVQSKVDKGDIQEILLVGGATRIPCVVASIQSSFIPYYPTPITIRNLDEAVAYGCAIKSAIRSGCSEEPLNNMVLFDILHRSLGVSVIPKSNPSSKDGDHLPADGGAPHESVLKTVIKRNTTIPTKRFATLSTVTNDQTTAHIQIYEGDYDEPSSNTFLGSFELHGIPKPPSQDQLAKVEVEFDLDGDGACVVRATHKEYGYATRSLAIRVGKISQQAKRAMIARAQALDGELCCVYVINAKLTSPFRRDRVG
jgi:L1 cell adhesion molecule like protein